VPKKLIFTIRKLLLTAQLCFICDTELIDLFL
jgi:hypothetical protein